MNGVRTNSEMRRNNLRRNRVYFARDFQKGYVRKVVSGFFWMMEGDDPPTIPDCRDRRNPLHHGISRHRPEASNRSGEQSTAKRDCRFAIVKHHPHCKPLSDRFLELAQPAEISGSDRCRRLDLDSRNALPGTFQDNIDFHSILVTEMMEGDRLLMPTLIVQPNERG